MMLEATQSWTCEYDGKRIAIHRGRSRVADGHQLAHRFPHRFTPVPARQEAAERFGHLLAQAGTYDEYRALLDHLEVVVEAVHGHGEYRAVA